MIYLIPCPEPALEQFCCHINRQHFIGNGGYRVTEWDPKMVFEVWGFFCPLLLLDDWGLSIVGDYCSQYYFRLNFF